MTDITVVMATYRQRKYIREAYESIDKQSVEKNLKIVGIVGDRKSGIKELSIPQNRVQNYPADKMPNMWEQRQLGLIATDTPYISFFDSDDVMLPGWLEKGLKVAMEIVSRGKIPIVGPSYRMVDEKLRPLGSTKPVITVPTKNGWPDMDIIPFGIGKSYAILPKALTHYPSDVILPEFSMDRMMEGSIIPDFSITKTENLRMAFEAGCKVARELFTPQYSMYCSWLELLKRFDCEVKLLPDIGFLYRQHRGGMHNRFKSSKRASRRNVEMVKKVAQFYYPEGGRKNG